MKGIIKGAIALGLLAFGVYMRVAHTANEYEYTVVNCTNDEEIVDNIILLADYYQVDVQEDLEVIDVKES